MTTLFLLFIFSAIGVAVSIYLFKERRSERTPVCFIGQNCNTVLGSKYNKTLGIHNDLLGLLYYMGQLTLISLLVINLNIPFSLAVLILVGSIVAAIMSARFVYLQAVVIKAWCSWCLVSAFLAFEMLLISLLRVLGGIS